MWHKLSEVALSWPAMWHRLGEVDCCGCAIWHGLGEVDHWLAATWHYDGTHLSGYLCHGGAHLLTWTNGRVPRGTQLLRWPNQGLPCGTVIVIGFLNWRPFLSPNCTQNVLCPQVVPREAYDQITSLDLLI
jgi:hypothetical protein